MINNPDFAKGEDQLDIHATLKEIDNLRWERYLSKEMKKKYEILRANWKKRYISRETKTRQEFVDDIIDFRNEVLLTYNDKLEKIDKKNHKI